MKKIEAELVGKIIDRAFAATGNRDDFLRQQALYLWPEVVGPTINRHTMRRWLDRDVMHVCLNSSVLKNELLYLTDSICRKLNELMGETVISKIIIH